MISTLPYTALRAFEAVVRTRGFGRAAEELGITQSAVSQHVKALEGWTGRVLLIRGPRASRATAEGQLLADAVAAGLGRISDVCDQLRRPGDNARKITVSCPAGFAVNWLFPRLVNFDQAHPDLPVSISTDAEVEPVTDGAADVAISYGIGRHPGLHVEHLLGEEIFPVCAPSLPDTAPLRGISDLARHTMLVDEIRATGGNPPTWQFWADATGETLPEPARVRRFGQSSMSVQAAIQGIGLALGRGPVVIDALIDGTLVRPFPGSATSQFSYWFVCRENALKSARIRLFRDWLQREAAAQPDLPLHRQPPHAEAMPGT